MRDHTHNPSAASWVEGADAHPDFPVQNLPLGVFSTAGTAARIGTAIGDYVLDLSALATSGVLPAGDALSGSTLNALFARPSSVRTELRHAIFALLTDAARKEDVEGYLYPAADVTMHLPAQIGDYTDFYVGIHHATNIGKLFRPDNPLLPNYKHIPIGYHGRASSVRVSGTPVIRPNGQRLAPGADAPEFGPCRRLDYELELGIWIAGQNALGTPVAIADAATRVAGFSILNDWSARDIQAWEYQPLGPFLAKNFLTSVSPWVVTAEALAPFHTAQPPRPAGHPRPLPYLWDETDQAQGALALELTVSILTTQMREAGLPSAQLSQGPATNMYWTVAQMIAHHSSGGCDLNPGDLLGSGTISSPFPGGFGSLMEISGGGKEPFALPNGESRSFLEDGDEIIITAKGVADGARSLGFGQCIGRVLPAPVR
jgi:fumarylacetoacetase